MLNASEGWRARQDSHSLASREDRGEI